MAQVSGDCLRARGVAEGVRHGPRALVWPVVPETSFEGCKAGGTKTMRELKIKLSICMCLEILIWCRLHFNWMVLVYGFVCAMRGQYLYRQEKISKRQKLTE
jgi:hypothetical protein